MALRKIKVEEVTEEISYKCDFCKSSFKRESSLVAHACEKKRRWLWKDEKYAMMGFRAYQKFYEISMKQKKAKTQADFIDSTFYLGFTKFGKRLVDINAIEPLGFVDFLIRANVRLEDWCAPRMYEVWIRELGKKEHPDKAVERNILLMEQWSKESGEPWEDFFRSVNPQLATKWIKTGRISPWLLYTVGDALIERLSDEQLGLVQELIEPNFWFKKIEQYAEEVKGFKEVLRSAGV